MAKLKGRILIHSNNGHIWWNRFPANRSRMADRIRNGLKKFGWTIRWSKRVGAITQARQKAWRFSFEAGDREPERHPRRPARTIEDFS